MRIGGLERSDSGRIDKRGEADSRAEPHLQEPPQCPAKINADWRFGAKRQRTNRQMRRGRLACRAAPSGASAMPGKNKCGLAVWSEATADESTNAARPTRVPSRTFRSLCNARQK